MRSYQSDHLKALPARHEDVGHDQVRGAKLEYFPADLTIPGLHHRPSGGLENTANEEAVDRVIVHNKGASDRLCEVWRALDLVHEDQPVRENRLLESGRKWQTGNCSDEGFAASAACWLGQDDAPIGHECAREGIADFTRTRRKDGECRI